MRPKNFDELLEAARSRPMLPEALKQLGVEIKKVGHSRRTGSIRWQTTKKSGHDGDLSSIVFFQKTDGSWAAVDNKQRTGKRDLDALGVLTNLFGVSFEDAVYMLSGGTPSMPPKTVAAPVPRAQAALPPEPVEFVQPPKAATSNHAAAYLIKTRLIPDRVVSKLLHLGAIYESSWHMIRESTGKELTGKDRPVMVFPILNEKREMVGADTGGTYSVGRFKSIAEGSDPLYGWRFGNYVSASEITRDTKLYFCESPIDAISLYCITNAPGMYISMAGNKDITFEHMTKLLGGTPVICNDNDEAGNNFRKKYPQCETMVPEIGKDWNDELKYRVTHGLDYALKPPDAPEVKAAPKL